jgi:hypothetical protein
MPQKLTREELISLVRKIANSEGTEEEINEWMEVLRRSVPHPAVSGLIFWPKEPKTPEQIVDEALAYRPIRL